MHIYFKIKCLPIPCSHNNHLAPIDTWTGSTQTTAPNGHPNLNVLHYTPKKMVIISYKLSGCKENINNNIITKPKNTKSHNFITKYLRKKKILHQTQPPTTNSHLDYPTNLSFHRHKQQQPPSLSPKLFMYPFPPFYSICSHK